MQDILPLILSELQALRVDYNEHARETGERLSALEAQMYGLCGNGQPGRIAKLEAAVQRLKEWRWWLVGVGAGAGGVVSLVAWMVLAAGRK